jgi:hypothetical protein
MADLLQKGAFERRVKSSFDVQRFRNRLRVRRRPLRGPSSRTPTGRRARTRER